VTPYPLHLDLRGRRAVVVGGGPVAARRAAALADAGALVVVVAPWICEDIANDSRLEACAREWEAGDLEGAWLVHTATGDRTVDAAVSAEAEARRIWCVRADDAGASAAWTPAVLRRDDVVVSVTAGGDPRRAKRLRDAVAAQLDAGTLPQRRHRRAALGHVALVGGGPGDPGLITTRGRALLAQADVVIVDRLAPRALLEELDEDVEVIEAGKAPHAHTLTQTQIEDLLVDRARAGLRVVRLKGGDPYVLGRGGEEALACVAAGVPVEVVPGVTSAVAVPALAGIPVTHRGLARGFTVVSAHDCEVDWGALAAVEGTLVVLMGVGRLAEAAAGLIAAGRPGTTPVAVVEDGTTPRQRSTLATLADVADVAAARGVRSPAVVVVGEVVRLADALGPQSCQTVRAPERPERLTPQRAIVLAAHGSPDPRHAQVVEAVVEALRAQGRDASVGWLDHGTPLLAEAVVTATGAVVVPFLLAPAFHAREDVPAGAGAAPVAEVLVPDPATPDARLVDALVDRLTEAGRGPTDALVLAAVGSRDPAHAAVVTGVAAALRERLGVPVGTAYATTGPSVSDAVAALRDRGGTASVALASLFLAPGRLHDAVAAQARACGVRAVAEPLGAHPMIVDLVAVRADAAR
jgi:uroporphyrin-III C-methyltransferase / precorrin-2 dehydrogenase / sirohydrochlorin ferrochelatase